MASSKKIKELHKLISKIINDLRRKMYAKEIFQGPDFERYGKGILEDAFNLIGKVKTCDLSIVPDGYFDQIYTPMKEHERLFEDAISIDETQEGDSPIHMRSSVIENIKRNNEKLFEAMRLVPIFQDNVDTLKKIADKRDEATRVIEDKGDEATRMFESASAKKGVHPSIVYYEEVAKKHADTANKWYELGVKVFFAFILSVVFAVFVVLQEEQFTWGSPRTICFFLLFSILGYALFFCNKNYDNEKHNEIVNTRKARSLSAFLYLMITTEDKNARIQIVIGICSTIFANNATGYNKKQDIPLPPQMEIFRTIKELFKRGNSP